MNKYNKKKKKNQEFFLFIKNKLSDNLKIIIENCSTFLMFYSDESLERKKLMNSNSCKNRFCPFCAYKKARKDAYKISIMMKYLILKSEYDFLFLTLTSPNVIGSELENEIKDYSESFKRLRETKEFKKINQGYIRKLEITHNSETNTYHPHYHVLLCVNKSYFKSRNYIKREKWLEMWKLAKRDNSITQVDIKKIDITRTDDKSILEIAKYSAKDTDYLKSQKIFDIFYESLKGKQVITYNKIFKDISKKYDTGELDYLKEIDNNNYIFKEIFQWVGNDYNQIILEKLSEEDKQKMNNLIDEIEI